MREGSGNQGGRLGAKLDARLNYKFTIRVPSLKWKWCVLKVLPDGAILETCRHASSVQPRPSPVQSAVRDPTCPPTCNQLSYE